MSKRVLSLPLRLATSSRSQSRQWTCKRCLATQAEPSSSRNNFPPMPAITSPSSSDHDLNTSVSLQQSSVTARPEHGPPPLSKTDRLLGQPLWHRVPLQYLQHSTSDVLSQQEKMQRLKAVPHKDIVGVVVSAGKMDKTVKVRVPGQKWNQKLSKYFADHTDHLVHDPNNSLIAGDVVSLHRLRVSRTVHHVVAAITAPFGKPIDARPPVPTPDERLAAYKERRAAKMQRSDYEMQRRRIWRQGSDYTLSIWDLMQLAKQKTAKGEEDSIEKTEAIEKLEKLGFHARKATVDSQREADGKSTMGEASTKQGQKLPRSVLPGDAREVGKLYGRATRNKSKIVQLLKKVEHRKERKRRLRWVEYQQEHALAKEE